MLAGQLGSVSPPVQAHGGPLGKVGSSRTTESAGSLSLRRVRVPLVGPLLGTSSFLPPVPQRKMCLPSCRWPSRSSPGADPSPSSLWRQRVFCGLCCSLEAPWLCYTAVRERAGGGGGGVQGSVKEILGFATECRYGCPPLPKPVHDVKESGFIQVPVSWKMVDSHLKGHLSISGVLASLHRGMAGRGD